MPSTNMDPSNKPNATVPVLEFLIPKSEIDGELKKDSYGRLNLYVRVVDDTGDRYMFRKEGDASQESTFHDETVNDLRDRIKREGKIEVEE